MRNTILGFLAMTTSILAAGHASASDTYNTKVVQVRVAIGSPSVGIIQIDTDPDASTIPGCAKYTTNTKHHGRWFAVDLSTDGGRQALSVATAAQLSGKPIRVTGSGACNVNGNKEDLIAIYMDI